MRALYLGYIYVHARYLKSFMGYACMFRQRPNSDLKILVSFFLPMPPASHTGEISKKQKAGQQKAKRTGLAVDRTLSSY